MTATVDSPMTEPRAQGPRFSLRALMIAMLLVSVLLSGLWYLGQSVNHAYRSALRMAAQGHLNQLAMALHNYHDIHGTFPPAYIPDENSQPMHSWRVLILPYIAQQALYAEYRFEEPWNSPHNLGLAERMPAVFRSPTEPLSRSNTNMVVIVGPGTAFPGAEPTKLTDFTDGTENCILLTEIARSDICWLEPRDLDTTTMSFRVNDRTRPSISAAHWRSPYVVFADTIRGYLVPLDTPPDDLKALTTIAGGEPITRNQIWPP